MKVEVKSKKGLKTSLSIIVEKKTIQEKLEEKLLKLQTEVSLKGFRPGKVPSSVIKSQFGKAIYGEVIDQVLKESSMKALDDKKIKAAGQPKIDLKTFGEGKDLNYILEVESLPEIKIKSFQEIKALEYKVKVDQKSIESKLKEIAEQHKHYEDKEEGEKSELENQITFDYSATVDGNKFEGSEGKAVQIELGKNLFLEGFDKQLVGVKKNDSKIVEVNLPPNHPKKELANKRTKFNCKIISVKKAKKNKIDDEFAKHMGAKDLSDLKSLIEKQISSQYTQALNSITKKEILEQIESKHDLEVPKGLVDNELASMTQTLKKEEIEKHKIKNEKLAISRIKTGLILNEIGEKNHLKVTEQEIKDEINKQIKGMPGQEKMVIDYYQKNPSASQSLKGAIYEEKIINLLKTKIKLNKKEINIDEAERIINNLNKPKENKENPKPAKPKVLKTKKK